MAFDYTKLQSVNCGGSNSIHHYNTADTDTVVETAAYFDDAYAALRVGDFIFAYLDNDGTPEAKVYYVSASSSSGVTIGFPTIA